MSLVQHRKQWEFLLQRYKTNQLAHAYVFFGQKAANKEVFAKELAKFINCLYPKESKGCDQCQNCKMIESEHFPDLFLVRSMQSESSLKNGADMMEIEINQVRSIQNFLSYKPYYGNAKTVIVEDAERMNQESQHCFLKSLEEPKGKTLILLLTQKPGLLMPTIASRCQQITFFYGKQEISKEEQSTLDNLIKITSDDLAEKFRYVKIANLDGNNFEKILESLQGYFRELLLVKFQVLQERNQSTRNYSITQLKKILRLIERLKHQLTFGNINKKLALEILLMEL